MQSIIFFESTVSCGFPSPAEEFSGISINLNKELIPRPASSFLVRAKGRSMENCGIYDGDVLIVDRSLEAKSGNIIVAELDREFLVKRFKKSGRDFFLMSESENSFSIKITDEMSFSIWGVVTYVIHKL